jgi:hypothetical protein
MKMYGKLRSCELSKEERLRYRRWWKKYVTLKRVAQTGLPVCLLLGLLSFGDQELSRLAKDMLYPAFWVTVISTLWWTFLECPRCGTKFSGWWGSEFEVWSTSDCQECGLSCHDLSTLAKR